MLQILDFQNQTHQLKEGLKDFGLNPSDWQVLKDKASTYQVKCISDRTFVFKGQAQRKGRNLRWEKLELVSF